MCAGGFELISQVSSTLWPDINRRNYQSTDSGSNGPSVAQEPSSDHSRQAKPNWVKTRRPRTACWTKLGAVGPPSRPTDLLVGRPGPWAPPPQLRHVAPPCWLLKSVPGASARGSLLLIQGEGVEEWTHTHHTHSTHLSPLELEAFILDA